VELCKNSAFKKILLCVCVCVRVAGGHTKDAGVAKMSGLVVYAELEPDEFMDEEGRIHKIVSPSDSPREEEDSVLDASFIREDDHDVQQAFSGMVYQTPADSVTEARASSSGSGCSFSSSKVSVVLDCANIGYSFGEVSGGNAGGGGGGGGGGGIVGGKRFCVAGVELALKYFDEKGVDVTAFLPSGLLRRKPSEGSGGTNALMQTEALERLTSLVESGRITTVPAGDHDDCYILSYARNKGCFIVSNDLFADHIRSVDESVKLGMRLWLSQNRCGYCFVNGRTFMISPDSPLASIVEPLPQLPTDFQQTPTQWSHMTGHILPTSPPPQPHVITDGFSTLNTLIEHLMGEISQSACTSGQSTDPLALSSLRHLLVARCLLLLRAGRAQECHRQDVELVLQMEPCCCPDALSDIVGHLTHNQHS